jgi:lysophospholipase L1-like esterase
MLPGHNLWMLWFTLYVDGDSVTALTKRRDGLTSAGDSLFAFDLPVPAARGEHTYRLVLPVLSTPAFAGITLEGGRETLVKIPKQERPLYIAYGNSITHGQGQFTGDQTWPWVLAQQMGWQLCNLAVGGSKTSVPMAEMIARQIMQHVDYMTILIGFNDAVFLRLDTATYRKRLTDFIRTVRKGHPETEIFLLGQTYTEKKEDKEGEPLNFGDWRKVQCEVAEAFMAAGDRKVHYLNGALYTRHEDLKNPPRDVVHLNVRGAYHFGTALADTIRKILMR